MPKNGEYHDIDMISTTRFMSDSGGTGILPVAYTAFGERVCALKGSCGPVDPNSRYGYAGAWGYQAHDEFPFLHVGHRYYDPATGRFLQRDPIGINGGLTVYAYVNGRVTIHVDPSGLFSIETGIVGGIAGGIGGARYGVAGAVSGACIAFIAGGWEKGDAERLKDWWKENGSRVGGPPRYPVSCFVEGTKVHTVEGEASIESLTVGQRIATHDVETGENAGGRIGAALMGVATDLVHIKIRNETLTCTPEHRFWVIGRGWVAAGRLTRGDALLDIDGQQVPILGVEQESLCKPVRVYNITVDEQHTYFIGKSKVLVHNKTI